ncbi:MAG: phosphoglucosamine mutase [Chitinivibrionales bacterium]|nr:phosphoglucosamine mutase [Chitinivibrionales bacterium]
MSKLMVSVSGIRGIVGETLTPEVIVTYTAAFATLIDGGKVVVARDSRPTGEMVQHLVAGTLLAAGCEVVSLGIVPTPTTELMVSELNARGGIIITASHNPAEWNALKFLGGNGMFLPQERVNDLIRIAGGDDRKIVSWDRVGNEFTNSTALDKHIDRLLSVPYVNVAAIRARAFKVALDTNYGAAGPMGKLFLEKLGCRIVALGLEPTGRFAHACEPIPENLTMLSTAVVEEQADIGFAIDPDGDRVAIVAENGVAIGEEYTLAIAVKEILARNKGPVTLNLSTSQMSEQIARTAGCTTFRTPVGEINVSSAMKANASVIGGEGNGGAILPEVLYGRDAFTGMLLALQALVGSGASVSEYIKAIPSFAMVKQKVALGDIDAQRALARIEAELSGDSVNRDDGLRIARQDEWVHMRKSNTEPIMRIIAEAPTQERLDALVKQVKDIVAGC